jgi:hypothetical protein
MMNDEFRENIKSMCNYLASKDFIHRLKDFKDLRIVLSILCQKNP